MAPKSLFTQINKSILDCTIVGHRFLPCDVVDSIITRENLKDEISSGWKSRLSRDDMPNKITRNGKKLFAILLIIGEKHKIKDLLKEGITDNDLPFSGSTEPNSGGIRTSDPNKEVYSFRQWEEAKATLFLRSQWIVLAPVLETDGATITVDPLCPLPFIKGDVVQGPHHSIVYKSVLHSAHHTHHLVGVVHRRQCTEITTNTRYSAGAYHQPSCCRKGVGECHSFYQGEEESRGYPKSQSSAHHSAS